MTTNYLILLPPSENKNSGGLEDKPFRIVKNLQKYNCFISLNNEREFLYDKLLQVISISDDVEILEKIFELKGKNLQQAIEITQDILNESTMPAIQRYNGVMFNAINYTSLDKKQKQNFDESVIFIDGMFGILKPQDLIPQYKFKINWKIKDIDITNYWKENLKPHFKTLFKDKIIIDLLPEFHKKVLDSPEDANMISLGFYEIKNSSKLVNVGHNSKKLKGDLIKFIISKKDLTIEDLKKFKHIDGFKFSEKYSTDKKIVYLK